MRYRNATCLLAAVIALSGCDVPAPKPVLVYPEPDAVVSGRVVLSARQLDPEIDAIAAAARFEFAGPDGSWQLIDELNDALDGVSDEVLDEYTALWDTGNLDPGPYNVRVGMRLDARDWYWTDKQPVVVGARPIARISAELGESSPEGTVVRFSSEGSEDPDGTIVRLLWDFGDGESADGPAVEHLYVDTTQRYSVALSAVDSSGLVGSVYYLLVFAPVFDIEVVNQKAPPKCICKSIDVRRNGQALGSDAVAGGTAWPARAGHHDGLTLGPLDGNPGNGVTNGEKDFAGFAFEVLAEVDGLPADCKEFQVVKAGYKICGTSKASCDMYNGTYTAGTRCCEFGSAWRGTTADLDQDGTDDIDVATQAKCQAAGGQWDAAKAECLLNFPNAAGGGFKPDTAKGGRTRYAGTYNYKSHVGTKVVWWDAPRTGNDNGSNVDAQFISYLRGTDNRYCYAKFDLDYEKKVRKDDETITNVDTKIDQASLPGI